MNSWFNQYILASFLLLLSCLFSTHSGSAQNSPVSSFVVVDATYPTPIHKVCLSPDGNLMVIVGRWLGYHPSLWDINKKQLLLTYDTRKFGGIWGAVFSPDGEHVLVYGQPYFAALFETMTGKLIYSFNSYLPPYMKGFGVGPIMSAAFHPDGSVIFITDWFNQCLVYDAADGNRIRRISSLILHRESIEYSANGRYVLLFGGVNMPFVFDMENETIARKFFYGSMTVSPNKKYLAYIKPLNFDVLNFENLSSVTMVINRMFPITDEIALSNDLIAVMKSNESSPRVVFDAKKFQKIYEYPPQLTAEDDTPLGKDDGIGFFSDGKRYYTVNGTRICIWALPKADSSVDNAELY